MNKKGYQFNDMLNAFKPQPVIDLACGGCPFVGEMLSRGFSVQTIDTDKSRVPKQFLPLFKKQNAITADLSFANLVVCSGLLYHLTLPEQELLKSNLSGKSVLLDTHYIFAGSPQGKYFGVPRKPTASTRTNKFAFVHTISSLHLLFDEHIMLQALPHAFDRSWFMMVPKRTEP